MRAFVFVLIILVLISVNNGYSQEPIDSFRGIPWYTSLDAVLRRIGPPPYTTQSTSPDNLFTATSYLQDNQQMLGFTGEIWYHVVDSVLVGGQFNPKPMVDGKHRPIDWYSSVIMKLAIKYGKPRYYLINGQLTALTRADDALKGLNQGDKVELEWHDAEGNMLRVMIHYDMVVSYHSARLNQKNSSFEEY